MAQETLLLTTSDNHVIAVSLDYGNIAEKSRKMRLYEQLCENITYNDFFKKYNDFVSVGVCSGSLERDFFTHIDGKNTDFLEREINHFDFVKNPQNYQNNIQTNNNCPSNIALKPNTIHFDNSIDDAEIPELIKNLGFTMNPVDDDYDVYFNADSQKYEALNFNPRLASVNVKDKLVKFVRNHFTFQPAEYATLTRLISAFENSRRANPGLDIRQFINTISNAKEKSLFTFYAEERRTRETRMLLLKHELVHIKNKVLMSGFELKKNSKRLSVQDYYRLGVEDERSAYLSQIVNAVNLYLKKGNPKDFSMFDAEANELVSAMQRMPENARFSYVQNPKTLLDASFRSFDCHHRKHYDSGQFVRNMKLQADKIPLSAEADNDRSDFFKQRSLLYRFNLYNPQTKKYEAKNFTPYIDNSQEVAINNDNIVNIINPCQQILARRLAEFNRDKSRGLINPDLVEDAKSLMRDNLHKSRLVSNINGIEISDLAEDRTPNAATPPAKPRNPAVWSRDIEAYWSKFDGYKEIANNEDEYSFAIKEAKIRYTAKDKVQMGKDAQYDAYVKLLQEPTNKNRPVMFKDTLSKEQALKLYVACVKTNRKMLGAVPTDFKELSKLKDIPVADLQKCQQAIGQNGGQNSALQKIQQGRRGR